MSDEYKDIINLPHHVSEKHLHMSLSDRAAQFAPFAALTGFGDSISETGRLTDKRIELDEYQKSVLNDKLNYLYEHLRERPTADVTYFVKDEKKQGGAYITANDIVIKVDDYTNTLVLNRGTVIPFDDIVEILYSCGEE